MQGAFDAAVRVHDAGDVDCDTDGLQSKPGPYSSTDRGIVEVRPDSGDGVIACNSDHKLRNNSARTEGSHDPTQLARLGNRSLKCFGHQRLVVSLGAPA